MLNDMPDRSETLTALRTLLARMPSGSISADQRGAVVSALADAWEELDGGSEHGMEERKVLGGRAEDLTWKPPTLSFSVERHGRTVGGSTRADLHRWTVDVVSGTADMVVSGYRQLRLNDARWDPRPVAVEVAAAMSDGVDDPRVVWSQDGSACRAVMSKIVPPGPKQTTEGRTRRFRTELADVLTVTGWTTDGGWWTPPVAGR